MFACLPGLTRTGKTKRSVIQRDELDWIEVEGATPTIVSPELYAKAQERQTAPDRRSRQLPSHIYPLRGRIRCGLCGTPMVGHSLNRGQFLYCRCRHSYRSEWPNRCESQYVRCSRIEGAVKQALADLLADPTRILAEVRRTAKGDAQASESAGVLDSFERR